MKFFPFTAIIAQITEERRKWASIIIIAAISALYETVNCFSNIFRGLIAILNQLNSFILSSNILASVKQLAANGRVENFLNNLHELKFI